MRQKKDGESLKNKTIFDILQDVTFNKVKWKDQTTYAQKQSTSYMLNRLLSMNMNYIDTVNFVQQITINDEYVYNIYLDLLPKQKNFNKYINNKNVNDRQSIIDFFSKHWDLSIKEIEYIINKETDENLKNELKMYGFTDKEIKKNYGI